MLNRDNLYKKRLLDVLCVQQTPKEGERFGAQHLYALLKHSEAAMAILQQPYLKGLTYPEVAPNGRLTASWVTEIQPAELERVIDYFHWLARVAEYQSIGDCEYFTDVQLNDLRDANQKAWGDYL